MVKQRGFTAIELIVVLIVSVAAIGLGGQYLSNYADAQVDQAAADHMKTISDAAVKYIKDNYAAVTANATPTTPAVITVTMLKSTSYLTSSVTDQNAYGQTYQVLALQPVANKLQTLVITTGGETIPEMSIRRIAQLSGARGGFISTSNPATATGSYGGWSMPLASYGVSPGAGHIATALFFDDGMLVSDYLYRSTVPGHPELNRMNTAVDMGGNNVNNASAVNAQQVVVPAGNSVKIGNTALYGDSLNAAVRSAPGGAVYAQDTNGNYVTVNSGSVNANGNINASGNMAAGGAVNAQSPGGYGPTSLQSYGLNGASHIYIEPSSGNNLYLTTSGWNNTGSLSSYFGQNYFQNRVVANEYLQVAGKANVGWGCSPNGLQAQDASGSGAPLYCENGVWRRLGGISYATTYNVGYQQVADLGVHLFCTLSGTQNNFGTVVGNTYSAVFGNVNTYWQYQSIGHTADYGWVTCFD